MQFSLLCEQSSVIYSHQSAKPFLGTASANLCRVNLPDSSAHQNLRLQEETLQVNRFCSPIPSLAVLRFSSQWREAECILQMRQGVSVSMRVL